MFIWITLCQLNCLLHAVQNIFIAFIKVQKIAFFKDINYPSFLFIPSRCGRVVTFGNKLDASTLNNYF